MPPKKEKEVDVFVEVVVILVIVLFLSALLVRLDAYLQYTGGTSLWAAFLAFLASLYPWIVLFGIIITLAALYGIYYSLEKIKAITAEENKIFNPLPEPASTTPDQPKNPRWDKIVAQSNSMNPSDWQAAIIGADVMLEELLRAQGYQGDGVGDMLKSVEKSDFLTLDAAWDAHKVRNQIAHPTPDFDLTDRETKRVITEFESVFKEFEII